MTAKLLDRPLRRGVLRHIPVENLTRADLEDDEDIEDAETDGHRREEVTGDDRVCMIPHKRRPPLGPLPAARRPTDPSAGVLHHLVQLVPVDEIGLGL